MSNRRPRLNGRLLKTQMALIAAIFCSQAAHFHLRGKEPEEAKSDQKEKREKTAAADSSDEWRYLFNGEDLKGWEVSKFAGHGDVTVKDGKMILGSGLNLTGVSWTKDYPKVNYEIRLEAKRVEGYDFFCGLTFPVKDSFCSLIIGGWGGGVYGLSNIDGFDASANETTAYMKFETGRWYDVRLKVTDKKIQAWLDEKELVDVPLKNRKFSVRADIELAKPLGLSTWRTTAALKNVRLRKLENEEGEDNEDEDEDEDEDLN